MYFHEQAAVDRLERPMRRMRRAACIGIGREALASLSLVVVADDQVARDQIDLLPIFMRERRGRVDARRETEQSRTRPATVFFIQSAGEYLLLNPGWVANRSFPAAVHVQCVELVVLFIDRHLTVSWVG